MPPVTNITELNAAIKAADSVTGTGKITITLANDINLNGSPLEAINLRPGVTLDIEGAGHALDGGSAQRGLFVYAGTVDISNLIIANMLAKGGDGGSGAGGGGAGLGGGLFVGANVKDDPGKVTLTNVTFPHDAAVGGDGGAGTGTGYFGGGGGGGLGGNGGGKFGAFGGGGGGGIGSPSPEVGRGGAGDLVFATAAATAIFGSASTTNLVNVIDAWVTNWKAFYTSNGLPGIANATSAQIDLAARGAAWGDAVGVALDNNLGPLKALTTNFLMDAAEGIASYSVSLVGQPAHHPFQGEI